MPIDQLNSFFGIETPPDVKLRSTQMFENLKGNDEDSKKVLGEEEVFEKNMNKFFGIPEAKGPSFLQQFYTIN